MTKHTITTMRQLLEADRQEMAILKQLHAGNWSQIPRAFRIAKRANKFLAFILKPTSATNRQMLNSTEPAFMIINDVKTNIQAKDWSQLNNTGSTTISKFSSPTPPKNTFFIALIYGDSYLDDRGHSQYWVPAELEALDISKWVIAPERSKVEDFLDESLAEADRDERSLERAGDPEEFFKMAMRKLRRQRHLGQLRTQQWKALIDGAKLHKYHVYLARPPYKMNPTQVFLHKLTFAWADSPSHRVNVGGFSASLRLRDNGVYTISTWLSFGLSRPGINNSITKESKLILSQTDYKDTTDADKVIRELGLEDVFQNY